MDPSGCTGDGVDNAPTETGSGGAPTFTIVPSRRNRERYASIDRVADTVLTMRSIDASEFIKGVLVLVA
jgi:hypothetical protein